MPPNPISPYMDIVSVALIQASDKNASIFHVYESNGLYKTKALFPLDNAENRLQIQFRTCSCRY